MTDLPAPDVVPDLPTPTPAATAPATAAGATAPGALAEPTARVGTRFLAALTGLSLVIWMAFNATGQVLMGEQALAIAPADKENALATALTIGAAVAIFANPVAGWLSDRTTHRYGRRRPWIAVGALGGAAAFAVLAGARTVLMLTLGWCLIQLFVNVVYAAVSAAIPDQVPRAQRGLASGLAGITQPVGTVAGVGLAVALGIVGGYAGLAVALLLAAAWWILAVGDQPLTERPARERRSGAGRIRALVRLVWVSPRRHPDFAWAWITRMLVYLGFGMGTTYLLYYLHDKVGYERLFPGHHADEGVLILTGLAVVPLMVTVIAGGVLSDRVRRRKVFVIGSTMVVAVGLGVLAAFPTWPGSIAAALILGAGFGVYLSVDVALITEVLPAASDRAKDLGIINIASTVPQVIAPAVAAWLVRHGGGYPVMFSVAAAVTLLGAVLIQPIRGVR